MFGAGAGSRGKSWCLSLGPGAEPSRGAQERPRRAGAGLIPASAPVRQLRSGETRLLCHLSRESVHRFFRYPWLVPRVRFIA